MHPPTGLYVQPPMVSRGSALPLPRRIRKQGCAAPPAPPVLEGVLRDRWPELPLWADPLEALQLATQMRLGDIPSLSERLLSATGLPGAEGALAYIAGGTDLAVRAVKGILASATPKPGTPLPQQVATKHAMSQKILAYLLAELLTPRPADAPSFFLLSMQPLGSPRRASIQLHRSADGHHVHSFEPHSGAVVEVDRVALEGHLRTLLTPSSTGLQMREAYQSLFGVSDAQCEGMFPAAPSSAEGPSASPHPVVMTCCSQAQANLRPEAVTRRLWELLRLAGGGRDAEIFRSTVARYSEGRNVSGELCPDSAHMPLPATPETLRRHLSEEQTSPGDTLLGEMYRTSAFSIESYERMRDDPDRTGGYKRAIESVCPGQVVLEIGTGPFALLAIFAASAGAEHVYAVEADATAFSSAQRYVAALPPGVAARITLIQGLSSEVTLPRRAGVVVHELIGVLATEEGVVEAIRDASDRLLLPDYTSIPHRVSTRAALYFTPPVEEGAAAEGGSCGKRCECCAGGWSLGTGLEGKAQRSPTMCLEDICFAPGQLPRDSSAVADLPLEPAADVNSVGLWVALQLLESDTQEQIVSSFKDASCWPKCMVRFASDIPKSACAGGTSLRFESSAGSPMRYTFSVHASAAASQLPPPVVVYNRPPDALDDWLTGYREGLLVNPLLQELGCPDLEETRLTHLAGAKLPGGSGAKGEALRILALHPGGCGYTLRKCLLENVLSPLHRQLLRGGVGATSHHRAAAYRVRDAMWGLTAAHFKVLLRDADAACAEISLTDTHLGGTPSQWRELLRPAEERGGAASTATFPFIPSQGAEVESRTAAEFQKLTGRVLLGCDVISQDFVVEVLLRMRVGAAAGLQEAVGGCGAAALCDSGVVASRDIPKGGFVCKMHGEVKPISWVGALAEPSPDMSCVVTLPSEEMPYYLDVSRCASVGSLMPCASEGLEANCEKSLVPYGGTLCLVATAVADIKKGDPLVIS